MVNSPSVPTPAKRPRPALRAAIGGVCGAIAAGASRYDSLTHIHHLALVSMPVLVSVLTILGGGIAGGYALYLTGRKDLLEHLKNLGNARADDAAEKARREQERVAGQVRSRVGVLAVINGIADAQNRMIGSVGQAGLQQMVGRFKQLVVDGIRSIVSLLHEVDGGEMAVRVMFCETLDGQLVTIDGSQPAAEQGSPLGQLPMTEMKFSADEPFVLAANGFLVGPVECATGDAATSMSTLAAGGRDNLKLRSPDDPTYWLRVKICSPQRVFGVLFVDLWGTGLVPQWDIQPILAVSRMLAAGLSGSV